MGHAIAQGADLFRWAWRQERAAQSKKPKRNGFAAALAVVVEHGRRGLEPGRLAPEPPTATSVDERATCPKCGRDGWVHADFGLRRVNGKLRAQSWCRSCRAERADGARDERKTPALDDLPLWSNAH